MKDFLAFRTMLTPVIIQIVFWLGAAISVIAGLAYLVSGYSAQYSGGQQVLIGLLLLFVGPVVVRLYCEVLIIFFRINETLTEIRNVMIEERNK